jgi:hypothetical protein
MNHITIIMDHLAPYLAMTGIVLSIGLLLVGLNKLLFKKVSGIARNVVIQRQDAFKRTMTSLTFRVEVSDENGNIVQQIAVIMRGDRINGHLNDGDEVRVKGKYGWFKQQVQAERVKNLTTGEMITRHSFTGCLVLSMLLPFAGLGTGLWIAFSLPIENLFFVCGLAFLLASLGYGLGEFTGKLIEKFLMIFA